MIRARFRTDAEDPRPINWPLKHPYWVSGSAGDGSYSILIAYADSEEEILSNWPEAQEIESTEETDYQFTSRFTKPDWLK